ncbi:MAG: hypothetical protein C0506_12540 [Anaerolinea sp.]|nr:hypothetical protein [Anaerolinea sp.]
MKRSLAYELLSPVRQQLVLTLKKRGHGDMETLAAELFLSPGAVRQNLSALSVQGLVRYTVERSGPGRPRHVYQLTSSGQRIFPDFYDEIADALLTAIEGEGPETARRLFDRVAEVMFSRLVRRLEGRRPGQRIDEVVKLLDEYGYLPEPRQLDALTIEVTAHHCPLFALARRHPATCESELRCLQLAAGLATVARTEHRIAGDARCTFVFRQN